jgi:hypothetical protein
MTTTTQEILERFGQLPISEKKIVVSVILRDALETETPDLSDDELVLSAEELFLELDQREASDGES